MSNENGNGNGNGGAVVENLGPVIPIKVSRIKPNPKQPRKYFNDEALANLGRSLKRRQRQPIKVIKVDGDPDHDYMIDDGERRWRAAKLMGITHLSAWVVPIQGEDQLFIDSIVSNFCRADHTPLEKAEGLKRLSEMGMTRAEIAEECGYTVSWVGQHLSLLELVPEVQALMDPERDKDKQLPFSLALRLVPLPKDLQREVAQEIVDKKVPVAQARFLINTRSKEAGGLVTKYRSPNKDYNLVAGFITRLDEEARLVLNMHQGTYVSMLGSRSDQDISFLVGKIDSTIEIFGKLKDKIRAANDVVKARFGTGTPVPVTAAAAS